MTTPRETKTTPEQAQQGQQEHDRPFSRGAPGGQMAPIKEAKSGKSQKHAA